MPFSRDWDESAPQGDTAAAADIDEFIQHVRQDVRERISHVIPGWTDEGEDPKRAVIRVGEAEDRPASGDAHAGEFYYSLDEDTLDLFDGTAWKRLLPVEQPGADSPSQALVFVGMSQEITIDSDEEEDFVFLTTVVNPRIHYPVMWRSQYHSSENPGEWTRWIYGPIANVTFSVDPNMEITTARLTGEHSSSPRFRFAANIRNHGAFFRHVTARFQIFAHPAPESWLLNSRTDIPG